MAFRSQRRATQLLGRALRDLPARSSAALESHSRQVHLASCPSASQGGPLMQLQSRLNIPLVSAHPCCSQPQSTQFIEGQVQAAQFSMQSAVELDTPKISLPTAEQDEASVDDLPPSKVVELLNRFIVGQSQAKKAVAIALRNRWRRRQIEGAMKAEIVPKNILMIGPTGCGKTEIARRLAKLTEAPFIKVEATKFTEVGFHGRDVDQIIRDLLENAIQLQRTKMRSRVAKQVEQAVENKILDLLVGIPPSSNHPLRQGESVLAATRGMERLGQRETFRGMYQQGLLDQRRVQMEVPQDMPVPGQSLGTASPRDMIEFGAGHNLIDHYVKQMEKAMKANRLERREFSVAEAREILKLLETEKMLSADNIVKEAIELTESDGIVFLDEIDKIVSSSEMRHGADASAEGVQRDLLPIIEGSVVSTRHGNVNTEHILFICSGAFHSVKPSDMMAELQGRLPIRVELKGLTEEDLFRILTEPETNMIRQQQILMLTEGVKLVFTDAAIRAIAAAAAEVNRSLHNIGARRLHTVLERVIEDISFNAPDHAGKEVVIDEQVVEKSLGGLIHGGDLSRYIL